MGGCRSDEEWDIDELWALERVVKDDAQDPVKALARTHIMRVGSVSHQW